MGERMAGTYAEAENDLRTQAIGPAVQGSVSAPVNYAVERRGCDSRDIPEDAVSTAARLQSRTRTGL